MFSGCNFQSNVCGTFKLHKHRKHNPHSLNDFKPGVVTISEKLQEPDEVQDCSSREASNACLNDYCNEVADNLPDVLVQNLAAILLKLEHLVHVPSVAIDDFLESVIKEIATTISASNPLHSAIGRGGSLCTAHKRNKFYKDSFSVIEPIEYCLNEQQTNTCQYVPILKSV